LIIEIAYPALMGAGNISETLGHNLSAARYYCSISDDEVFKPEMRDAARLNLEALSKTF